MAQVKFGGRVSNVNYLHVLALYEFVAQWMDNRLGRS